MNLSAWHSAASSHSSVRQARNTSGITFPRTSGFTLVELLVAILIFGILAMLAYGGLDSVMKSRDRTEAELFRLRQIQITFNQMQRDIEQLTARDGHDALGGVLPHLSAGQSGDFDLLMQYTRTGWRNPAKQTRSNLQRVAWRLDDHKLYRMSWPFVDRAFDDQATSTMVIDQIREVKIRFLDEKNEWQNLWPPSNSVAQGKALLQPLAIEVTITMEDWGDILRVFKVPG